MCVNKRKVIQLIDWLIPEGETERKREREGESEEAAVDEYGKQLKLTMKMLKGKTLRATAEIRQYLHIHKHSISIIHTHDTHTYSQQPHIHVRRGDAGKMLIKPTGNGAKAAANQVGGQQRSTHIT